MKGLDSDSSYHMISDQSYLYAENLRILSQINNSSETNIQYGELRSIQGSKLFQAICSATKILASITIRNYGVVIHQTDNTWKVTRVIFDYNKRNIIKIDTIFDSGRTITKNRYSVVGRYEDGDNIKIYIADGDHPIVCINIAENQDEYNAGINADNASAYPQISFNPIQFIEYVQGNIKPGMVQYSYRLYKKNSVYTDASPLTKLYPIYNRVENRGCNENEQSDCGIKFKIQIPQNEANWFDKILIYRIEYIQAGQLPTVELIKNEWISNRSEVIITDLGQPALQTISIEEFNSFSGIHIIPTVLESQNDYLFAGKIKTDNTIDELVEDFDTRAIRFNARGVASVYRWPHVNETPQFDFMMINGKLKEVKLTFSGQTIINIEETNNEFSNYKNIDCYQLSSYMYQSDRITIGGEGPNIKWKFIYLDNTVDKYSTTPLNELNYKKQNLSEFNLRTLRPGETYRYGIIFYNKLGESSSVKWICDITVPQTFKTYISENGQLKTNNIGVQFDINWSNLSEEIISYEIVRCNRTNSDIYNVSQGVLSRPIRRYEIMDKLGSKNGDGSYSYSIETEYPLTPTGFLTTQNWWSGNNLCVYSVDKIYEKDDGTREAMNVTNSTHVDRYKIMNYKSFQFVSPEIIYNLENFKLQISNLNLKVCSKYKLSPYTYNTAEHPRGFNISSPSFNSNFYIAKESNDGADIVFQTTGKTKQFYDSSTQSTEIEGWGRRSIFDIIYKKNTDNFSSTYDTVKGKQSGNWYNLNNDVFTYIKLYNFENTALFTEHDVKSINFANELKWNEFAENGKTKDDCNLLYTDKVIPIGDDQFCNVIVGHMYGIPISKYTTTDDNVIEDEHASATLYGAGGRCSVLQLKDDANEYICDKFGTIVCNIVNESITPYGGFDFNSRKYNTYYSTGYFEKIDRSKNSETVDIFDGDTYLYPIEYVSMHKIFLSAFKSSLPTTTIIYSLPLESYINPCLTSGNEFSRNYNDEGITNLQIEPSNVNNYYTQTKPLYEYNTVYSTENKTKMHPAYDEESIKDLKNTDYRMFHSNLKTNDEYLDSWLRFQSMDFLDVDSEHGPITELKSFNNRLYYWQENAVGILSVNERTVMNNQNNMPLILGEGGVLTRYDYLDQTSGMKEHQYCDVVTSEGLYYFDDYNNSIYKISQDGIINLTDSKNVRNIMNNKRGTEHRTALYDPAYKEVQFNILDNGSIVYNEKLQQFTSVYTTEWDNSLRFNQDIYLLNINKYNNIIEADKWNELGGKILNTKLRYVVNKQSAVTKVFDNQEIVSSNRPFDDKIELTEPPFANTEFSWTTDINQSNTHNLKFTDREGNFRYAIPRANDSEYGNRIRGKYMICDIEGPSNYNTSITYIITKFRGSLS